MDTTTITRRYAFTWDLLGDLAVGRPNLGPTMRVEAYRLMQFTLRDEIEQRLGAAEADLLFYKAGFAAGKAFGANLVGEVDDLGAFVRRLQELLLEMGIGVLRVEKADMEKGELILTVSEDLDCSGLPMRAAPFCTYDEGFVAALLEQYAGRPFRVREIDCWTTGARTCRFEAVLLDG
jgi:predicted hydrocarbon binding protein